jgi:hypothetical protein
MHSAAPEQMVSTTLKKLRPVKNRRRTVRRDSVVAIAAQRPQVVHHLTRHHKEGVGLIHHAGRRRGLAVWTRPLPGTAPPTAAHTNMGAAMILCAQL